jgi:hypothetical protein
MNTFDKWLLRIAAGGITLAAISIAVAAILVSSHIDALIGNVGKSSATIASILNQANRTAENINRPCKGPAGPDACGTLAQINKTAIDAGDAIVRTQLVERETEPHIVETMDEFGQTAKHLSGTADSLSVTARAATGTLDAATETIGEGKRTITAAQPLFAAYTASGNDLDALLKRKSITDTMDNLAGITGHANGLTSDLQRVTDKATADYLSPKPWYRKAVRFAGDTYDYGALFARHAR